MEDSILKQVLTEELERIKKIEIIYREEIQNLPKGYIIFKKIKGKQYAYLQYREGTKTKSFYIKSDVELNELQKKILRRKELEQALKRTAVDKKSLEKALRVKNGTRL